MELFDKDIHKQEIKLRMLLTNGCNMNCKFCLNDFQPKPKWQPNYMKLDMGVLAMTSYVDVIGKNFPPQIYFSGGEPTLHPLLPLYLSIAKRLESRVTLVTNGSFKRRLEKHIINFCDCVHISAYKKSKFLAKRAQRLNASIQCVHSTKYPYVDGDFLQFYLDRGLHVKVFQDFHDNGVEYNSFANHVRHYANDEQVSFRFTGPQGNRGPGCKWCDRKCVTLRAAWVFPDSGTSPCPQLYACDKQYPAIKSEWDAYFRSVREFHEVKNG